MKVNVSELHPAYLTDEIRECPGPAADAPAEDHLQRFALPLVRAFVDEHRHRRLRLPFPDVSFEGAERHYVEPVQAHVAIIPLADVPRQNAFAVVIGGGLGEGTGTGNAAAA